MRRSLKLVTVAGVAAGALLLTGCNPEGGYGTLEPDPYGVDWGSHFGSDRKSGREFSDPDVVYGGGAHAVKREFRCTVDREFRQVDPNGWGPLNKIEVRTCTFEEQHRKPRSVQPETPDKIRVDQLHNQHEQAHERPADEHPADEHPADEHRGDGYRGEEHGGQYGEQHWGEQGRSDQHRGDHDPDSACQASPDCPIPVSNR